MALEETNLKVAIEHMQARYRALTVYMKRLKDLVKKTGKPVPRDVMLTYNQAAADHMKFSNKVFDALNKNKLTVEQVVYRDGEPVPDPNNPGHVRTLKIGAPLRPPVFVIPKPTPTETKVAGEIEMGIAPLVLGAYIVGGLIITSIAGYVGVKALEQIRLTVQGPDYKPDKQVEAYLKVYEKLVATGLDPKSAAEQATGATAPPPPKPGTGWFGPTAMVGVAVAGLGALILLSTGTKLLPSRSAT